MGATHLSGVDSWRWKQGFPDRCRFAYSRRLQPSRRQCQACLSSIFSRQLWGSQIEVSTFWGEGSRGLWTPGFAMFFQLFLEHGGRPSSHSFSRSDQSRFAGFAGATGDAWLLLSFVYQWSLLGSLQHLRTPQSGAWGSIFWGSGQGLRCRQGE